MLKKIVNFDFFPLLWVGLGYVLCNVAGSAMWRSQGGREQC